MFKYKPGDTVRVREDLSENFCYPMADGSWEGTHPVPSMTRCSGKQVTISGITSDGLYTISEDCGEWFWTDAMFVPAEELPVDMKSFYEGGF